MKTTKKKFLRAGFEPAT